MSGRTFRESNDKNTIREDNSTLRENNTTIREDNSTLHEEINGRYTRSEDRPRFVLPDVVAARYDWAHNIGEYGGEADVGVIRERDTGIERFFKLYHRGICPDEDVLHTLQHVGNNNHTVDIIEYNFNNPDECWEIHEYCPLGSIYSWIQRNLFPYNDDFIINFIKETSEAIHFLHHTGSGIAHRDIKPSNILIKSENPLDLVLTDYGIARENSQDTHRTTIAISDFYSAPEAYNSETSVKSDWWSLGSIIFELMTHRKLLGTKNDWNPSSRQAQTNCVSRRYYQNVDKKNCPNERMLNLIRGLTTYERNHRWGYEEISNWLDGDNPDVYWVEARAGTAGFSAEHCYQPPWEDTLIQSPKELAHSFANNWNEAKKSLNGREVVQIKEFLKNFHDSDKAIQLLNSKKSIEKKLIEFQLMADTDNDPLYAGHRLNTETIKEKINDSYNNDDEATKWLFGIIKCNALVLYGEYKNDSVSAHAGNKLYNWYKQAEEVKKLVPKNKQNIANTAFLNALPDLYVKAFEN